MGGVGELHCLVGWGERYEGCWGERRSLVFGVFPGAFLWPTDSRVGVRGQGAPHLCHLQPETLPSTPPLFCYETSWVASPVTGVN